MPPHNSMFNNVGELFLYVYENNDQELLPAQLMLKKEGIIV